MDGVSLAVYANYNCYFIYYSKPYFGQVKWSKYCNEYCIYLCVLHTFVFTHIIFVTFFFSSVKTKDTSLLYLLMESSK